MPRQIKYGEKTLRKSIGRLRMYCHVDDCENEDVCPERCMDCELSEHDKVLDLDTAIAWTLAEEVDSFCDMMEIFNVSLEDFYYHFDKFREEVWIEDKEGQVDDMETEMREVRKTFDELNDSYRAVVSFRAAINYHYHKYEKLASYISNVSGIMYTAWSRAKEALGQCNTRFIELGLEVRRLKAEAEKNEHAM